MALNYSNTTITKWPLTVRNVFKGIVLLDFWPYSIITSNSNVSVPLCQVMTGTFIGLVTLRPIYTRREGLIWSVSVNACIISDQLRLQPIFGVTHLV